MPGEVTRSPAKHRLISTLKEIARAIDALPEPVCLVLEESRLLSVLRTNVETLSNVAAASSAVAPLMQQLAGVARGIRRTVAAARR